MFKKYILLYGLTYLLAFSVVHAQEPPPPLEVANTVSNLWISRDFDGLNAYVTNLYTTHSNYVPAILAKSFHDGVFEGKLSAATSKLHRVEAANVSEPDERQLFFQDLLGTVLEEYTDELNFQLAKGKTPAEIEASASPSAVRNTGNFLFWDTLILFYAPATNVP